MAWLNSLDDHPITNQVTSFSTNISKLIVSHNPQKSLQKVCIFCETLATPTKILECAHLVMVMQHINMQFYYWYTHKPNSQAKSYTH